MSNPPDSCDTESDAERWETVIESGQYAEFLDWQDERYIASVEDE